VAGLQALICTETSRPVSDSPSGVFLLCFLSPSLPFLPCLLAVPLLPRCQPSKAVEPAARRWARSALPMASRSPHAVCSPRWLCAGPGSSLADRCPFCLRRCRAGSWLCKKPDRAMLRAGSAKDGLSGGQGGRGTECQLLP